MSGVVDGLTAALIGDVMGPIEGLEGASTGDEAPMENGMALIGDGSTVGPVTGSINGPWGDSTGDDDTVGTEVPPPPEGARGATTGNGAMVPQ
jgi:hypothetical protein